MPSIISAPTCLLQPNTGETSKLLLIFLDIESLCKAEVMFNVQVRMCIHYGSVLQNGVERSPRTSDRVRN